MELGVICTLYCADPMRHTSRGVVLARSHLVLFLYDFTLLCLPVSLSLSLSLSLTLCLSIESEYSPNGTFRGQQADGSH